MNFQRNNNIFLFIDVVPCPAMDQNMMGNDIETRVENVGFWEECGEYLCIF